MIIVTERNKQNPLSEDSYRVPLQNFVKLVDKKTECQANWTSKAGFTTMAAEPPAFCGFNNGYFYIAVRDGLSVNFHVRSIVSITKERYNDGTPDKYFILIRDGSKIGLSLL
jgi:hypothetical protein